MTVTLLVGANGQVASWVSEQLGGLDFGQAKAIGVLDGETLIAGVVYNNYRPHSVEASIAAASPRWATRSVLRGIFQYPFELLKVRRLSVTCDAANSNSRRFVERLGFAFEGIGREAWPTGVDAAVYSMLPNECKWLE